jgi:uncharacterized delta-60 repeat protein
MQQFAGRSLRGFLRNAALVKIGLPCLLLGLAVNVARAGTLPLPPANDLFTNAFVIPGISGTTNGVNNTSATLDNGEPTPLITDDNGTVDIDNSVWYLWTAPTNGTVQFNTTNSDFDTVLAVYTGNVTTNGIADSSITLVGADDDSGQTVGGDVNPTSLLNISNVVAGTTYYISVNGNADDLGFDTGNVVLNWSMSNIPVFPSGTFKFTSANYVVSERDSTPLIQPGDGTPVGGTASESLTGARITVTRSGSAYGRALVDYQFTTTNFVNYTNYFYTNIFWTNVMVEYKDTNGFQSVTNLILTYGVYSNHFGYYYGGYKEYVIPGAYTNFTEWDYINNYGSIVTPNSGPLVPLPPGISAFTNTVVGFTNLFASPEEIFTTNYFSFIVATNGVVGGVVPGTGQTYTDGFGTTYTNQEFDITNTTLSVDYGTNITLAYYYPGDVQAFTNIDFTNLVTETLIYTNAIYTNGTLTADIISTNIAVTAGNFYSVETDTTNNPVLESNDVGTATIAIPKIPRVGNITRPIPPALVVNSGSITLTQTNSVSLAQTVTNQIVPSTEGIAVNSTGTLTFNNFQNSQDILIPVNQTIGPDDNYGLDGVPSVAQIFLTNARLDSAESPELNPVTIDPVLGTAVIAASSTTFPTGSAVNQTAIFDFERSAFRVDKNVSGGNATVSVVRTGDTSQSVTVQFRIDYNNNNTFTLQAGSDYATPGSDFTSVTDTLTFPASPNNGYDNQQFTIPILNNSLVEFNEDMLLQLYNPNGASPGAVVGEVGTANLTILFDDTITSGGQSPGQQPAGAADRSWNQNNVNFSDPPYINYPGTAGNGGTVYAVAVQPDGNAIVAGSFNSFDSHPYNRIVRLLSSGYRDTTFLAAPNSGANDFISSLALQPDGKIIIGGNFTSFNGQSRYHIARLNSDGTLDSTFTPGLGANGMVWSVALQTNGQVVIGGAFTSVNGTALNGVARLNADGSVDTSFNPGVGPNGIVRAVAVDSIGRVIIGGEFNLVSGVTSGGVARLSVNGTLDTTFNAGIGTYNSDTGSTDPVYSIAVQANGQILVGGGFSYYDLDSYNGIVRLNTDGTVDLNFTPGTGTFNPFTGFSDAIYNISLQTNGAIYIGGDFTTYNQTRRVGIARLYSDGTLDTSFMDTAYNQFAGVPNFYFNPDATNANVYPPTNGRNYVYAIGVESGGNVIIGGGFYIVGGGGTRDAVLPRSNVARLVGGYTAGPGNIEMSYSSYTADKDIGGNGLYVSLLRASTNSLNPGITNNLGIVNATFSTNTAAPGPGIASGNNFTLSPAYSTPTWSTTWADKNYWTYDYGVYGPNYATIPIQLGGAAVYVGIVNDANITGNLNANFALSNPAGNFTLGGAVIPLGAALGTQSTATLTIIDDNITPGVLGFSPTNFSVLDNGTNAIITVLRTGGSDGVVQVSYATSNGTATNGINYNGVTNTITFGQGIVSNSFTIPVIAQSSSAPDKTLNVRLYGATGGATLGSTNAQAQLTIINHNYTPGHIGFSSATYSANENAGSALITVNRLGGSSGIMSVTLFIMNGSATNGVNYLIAPTNNAISTNTLSWAAGDTTARIISIPVKDDGVVTTNLTVSLQLANGKSFGFPSVNVLGLSQFTNATLNINNVDSAGVVGFTSTNYSIKKYGRYALIPVIRTGGSVGTITLSNYTSDGTALAGINYSNVNVALTFTNGQIAQYLSVPIIDDGTNDGLESFTISLTNAFPANSLGTISNATINIIDTEQGTNFPSVNETPGSVDETYDTLGLNNTAYALALQPNNQLLVGGDFTYADGVPRQRIARLNSNGTLDSTFSQPSSAYGANGSVRALAIQPDGRILVGGFFTNFNSVAINRIARLNYDGSLDSLFNPGSGADNPVYAIAATTNDVAGTTEIYIGGSFATVGGISINSIARLNSDGSLDTSFNPGLGANATVYALALQPDGKVVIGGDFTAVNGNTNCNHIARLNTDGSLDTNFVSGIGTGANGSIRAITLQLNGEILIGGLFTNFNGTVLNHIARLNANGSVDTTFHPGVGASDAVLGITLQTDSRIVLGGQFTTCSGVTRSRITRLNPDGSIDPTINFGTGANNFVAAVAIQEDTISGYSTNVPDEKIIIAGGFTQYNGQPQEYLARIYGGSIGGSGAFEFSSAYYQADENSTNAVITIVRTGGTSGTNSDGSGDVFVPFATSPGSAVAGVNYSNVIANLDFPEGEVIRTVTIPVMDDNVITTNLTVNLAVNPTPPAAYGEQPTALLTIINDDSAIVFSSSTYQVPKTIISGVAAINIQRIGSTNGTSTVVFNTTTNGTALIGTDYTPVTNLLVTFNPGVTNVAVSVPVNNNGLAEGNQTVTMQLSNTVGSLLYSPSNATLTIVETVFVPGQLSFTATNYIYHATDTNAYLTVARKNGSSGIVSVNYATGTGTAASGVDYSPTNGTLAFGDGVTNLTITIPLIQNGLVQGPVSIPVILSNPAGGATLGLPTNATVTILNTNTAVAFALATNTVAENAGFVSLNVLRLNNTNGTTTVHYSTSDGTAMGVVNYTPVTGVLTFTNGQTIQTIIVPLVDNPHVTGDLQFTVGLWGAVGAQLIAPSATTVIEQDADAGLNFTATTTSVLKNGTNVVLSVVCSNPRVEPVTVGYFTTDGTATNGIDYTATSGSLTFANGTTTNTIVVPIIANSLLEGNTTFSVILTNASYPGQLTPPSVETITIIDSNPGVSFSSPAYTVAKTGVQATISVYRTGYTNSVMSVDYATADGTATNGLDYVAQSGTLLFTNGVTNLSFTVPVVNHTGVQPSKTVQLSLLNVTNAVLASPTNATLTILDSTNTVITFALATNTVAENAGFASLSVLRLNNTSGPVTVQYATADGTAVAGTNYIASIGTLTFADGQSSTNIVVPLIYNPQITGDLQFTVGLTNPSNPALLISPSVTTVIEQDADAGVSFATATTSVLKSGTNAVISVVCSNPRAEPLTVYYLTADGTATNGIDYTGYNGTPSFVFTNNTFIFNPGYGTLLFAGGVTTNTFTIPIINNNLPEGNTTFSVVLFGLFGKGKLVAPETNVVTIIDSTPRVSFSSPAYAVSKNGVQATINVYRTGYTDSVMSVDYATADGTAVSGSDYVGTSGTLLFTNGVTNETFTVTVINRLGVQPAKTVQLSLSNTTNAVVASPKTATLTILDNTNAALTFGASSTTVAASAGAVTLNVLLLNNTNGTVSVNFVTKNGTATAGTNYFATNGILTFSNGVTSLPLTVSLINNTNLTGNFRFSVGLSNASSPAQLIAPSNETVVVQYPVPVNTQPSFGSPLTIGGDWGSDSFDNTSLANSGTNLVWYAWTPTNSGTVEFDTIGSVDDVSGITNLATYMGVYTGTNENNLNQVVINAGLYPGTQQNYSGQDIFSLPAASNAVPVFEPIRGYFYQPYTGPSQVRFNAVAGQTYYVVVQTYQALLSETESGNGSSPGITFNTVYSPSSGNIKLNWALHPSGVFRFATEDVDETGLTYSNGIPMLLYRVSETESDRRITGTVNANQYNSTVYGTIYQTNSRSGYVFDVPGVLVTVTRVAGSSGRVQVGYTTEDIATGSSLMQTNGSGYLLNGDLPAVSTFNFLNFTNPFQSFVLDYTPASGVLTFDDSEMSKTIFIPIQDDGSLPRQNRDFLLLLTNATLDSAESSDVQPPRLDNAFSQTLVRILDADISPLGPSQTKLVSTNVLSITNLDASISLVTNLATNIVYNVQPTNAVFNFQKAHYRVTRDIANYWGGTPITVYVNRMGTNTGSETVYWRVNSQYLDNSGDDDLLNGYFPLQPGSDYATPNPVNNTGILGLVPDFQVNGGTYHGTLTFPAGRTAFNPQPITFTIYNNGLQQFNEDFTISLYQEDSHNNPLPAGMVDQTTVTILSDDNHPPAGSVDEYYNADFSYNMCGPIPTIPAQMSHPGTDGEVYGLAVQPDNKTIYVGDFFTYDQSARNCIARANFNGALDTTFNPGSGANDFISCITLTTNGEALIGGAFSSFNGSLRNGIALLNTDGSLDASFNPGLGFNGTVNTLALQSDGRILVGGNFTSYNGTPRNHIARLNTDGSVDASFNPGVNLNAEVFAVTLQTNGQIVVGGDFTKAGGISGQNYIARLNADGSFDASFDPGSGANAPVFALATQPDGNIVVGGEFSVMNGQSQNRIARLNSSGFIDANFYSGIGMDGPVYNLLVQTNAILSTTNSSVVVQTNFTVYVGGAFTSYNGTHRLGFARLNSDGTLDTTFLDTAYNQFAGLPRERFADPVGTVLAAGIQSDGNVMIGGSFNRVGGGQSDDEDVRPESTDTNNFLIAESSGYSQEQKTRAGIRNRSNVARLVGGATPGPGNIGLLYNNYSVNKSQSPLYVSLIRTNGSLGLASANFAVLPGLAQNDLDYSYSGLDPLYGTAWESTSPMGRMHSDGFYGTNGYVEDVYGRFWSGSGQQSSVAVTIFENTNSLNNLNAQFQLTDPIGADQFYLGGEDIPLGVALGESLAPLTLIDDHHTSGTFGFSSSNYVGNGQSASIGVTRTNGTYGVVSMNYATTTNGSTAILNSDYNATGGTLSFQPSDTLKTFNVPILSSNYNSSVEKFVNIQLSALNAPSNGLASFNLTNAVLRIINPNFQGFLNLSAGAYTAKLSAGSVAITVTRTVGSKGTLNVQFATANGTAVSGTDFTGVTTNLQWNDGDVSPRTINISFINNGALGTSKQFGISLSSPTLNGVATPSLLGAVTNAAVTIINDNNFGTLQFSSPSFVVNENGGYATVTVVRTGNTNGTATVNFTNVDVTAFAGTNYLPVSGTLTFAPGQVATNINIPILDDGKMNPPPAGFFFQMTLFGQGTGVTLGSPSTVNVEIVDAESFNRPPGGADSTFNAGSGMNSDVFALALQSNGQILAGGNFIAVNGVPENYIARLNTDGSLDRSGFLYGLSGASGAVYSLVNQTDGQLLAGGAFTNFNGSVINRIARLNTDGSLDSSFNIGAGADNTVYALAETFSGGSREIYAGGAFSVVNGVSRPYIVRLNNNGIVDTAFSTGTGPNAPVYAVAVYPTNSPFAGKVLVGGAFTNINNFAVGCVARLNVDGSIDTNFDFNLNAGATVRAIAIQNDGRVLIGGDFTNVDGVALNHIARLNTDGSLDANFVNGVGIGANGTVSAIALQADNRIVVAGQFTQASGVTRNGITRLMSDGTVDPTINFGDGANGAVNAVVLQPADQMLVIGGSFTQYNDQTAGHIARIYGGSITGSGRFTFSSAGYQVNENGIQALIGIRRVGGTAGTNANNFAGDVYVNFATSPGTAVAGINYSNVITNVDFPEGEVLKLIPVPVMDDSNITPNLTVNLTLSTNVPGLPTTVLGDQATAVLNIINVEGAVSFGSATYSVAKNILTGYGVVNVVRIGTTNGTCSVNYSTTTNGTAAIGTDYYPTNGTITFNPGDTNEVIQVPIINNNLAQGNRTVILALTNAVSLPLYAPSNSTLTIIDTVQSPGLLSFSATNYVVNSSGGNATVTVVRTNGTTGSISVGYATVPGTALPGVSYQTTSGTLTFNDGDTNKSFSIPLIYQNNAQPVVALSVVLSNPSGGVALAAPTNSTVTILNTNTVFYFAAATNTAPENSGFVTVTVLRNNTNGTASLNFATADGTAKAGVNYVSKGGPLNFQNGQSSTNIIVPLIYNPAVTGDLLFTVALSGPSAGSYLAAPATNTVVVQDANAGLGFTNSTMSVLKNGTNAIISVVCSNPRVEPVSVSYFTADGIPTNAIGGATNGIDYVATNGTLTFSNGVTTNYIIVPLINNLLPEGNVAFNVSLTNATFPGQLVTPSNLTVTIVDSNPRMSFSSPTYTVVKTGVQATINVYRTGYTDSVASVDYATADGTGTNGLDYVATGGTLLFTNGVTNQTFTVTVINQAGVQPNKTVLLSLLNPTNAITVEPTNATLTIYDTNSAIAFQYSFYTNIETAGSINVNVQRTGSPLGTVTINYATTNNGTALPGTNYTPVSGTLTFASGQTLQAINIPLIYNPQVTGSLTFGVNLFSPTNAQLISPSTATAVVLDADVGLSFTNATMSVLKNGTNAVITVVCSNPALEPTATNVTPLSVNYFTADGSAIAGQDYTATSGTLLFTNGLATNTFLVPISNNVLANSNRTFSVNLTNATSPGRIISPSNQVVTIIDNNSGLSFSSPTYSVLRSAATATITVFRTDNTNQATSVNFTTLDGTAVAGTDYVATNGTFTFTNGETVKTFAVTVIANTTVQPDKTVLLQLSSPINGTLSAPSAATLTIHDTSGSLVVPDGSALTYESFSPANGIIDPGENVTLLFAFRASAGTNIANFSATLLATNGITSPTPVGTMNPGSLIVGGRPASQSFNFTASGTNGQTIAATFQLYNGASGIGTAVFTYTLGTWKMTVANTNVIIINDLAKASPYPASINISGVGGVIIKATVTLTNLYHLSPADIDALVVSPNQKDTLIMSHAGGGNAVGPVTLTFDDAATNSLPHNTQIISGTNKPTAYLPVVNFP